MRNLVLGLVVVQPRSLYDVHAGFVDGLSHIYAASYGSIHRALRQLEAAGDIVQVDTPGAARGKKLYEATAQGRRTWFDWMVGPEPEGNFEAAMLARVFLLGQLPDVDDRRRVVVGLLDVANAQLADLRAVAERVDRRAGDDPTGRQALAYPLATVGYGVRAGEWAVTWLEGVLAGLGASTASATGRRSR